MFPSLFLLPQIYKICYNKDKEEPEELVKFLKFVGADLSESEKDFVDAFIRDLQESVREVKASREMGARHMIFQEMLKDEHEAGREQELVELCKEFGKSKEETILKMMDRLQLKREEAEVRVERYWK